jgi:adenylate kinase
MNDEKLIDKTSDFVNEQQAIVREWLGTGSINVFGVQFSGKDTQLDRLTKWTHGVKLGGGALSRNLIDKLPDNVREATLAGELIPLHYFLELMTPVFASSEFEGKPLLLSAVGRWHGEEAGVMKAAAEGGHSIKAAVWLDLEEEVVWKRWSLMKDKGDREARIDDSPEGLRTRLKWFREKTLPVRKYYEEHGLLIPVDGGKTPDNVEAEILNGLAAKAGYRA